MHKPETLLYGHLCKDRVPETQTYEPGSPAWYMAHVLTTFEMKPVVISPYGVDYPKEWLGPVTLIPNEPTTTNTLIYENKYMPDGSRRQHAYHADTAVPVDPESAQRHIWNSARAIIVCPIVDNIQADTIRTMRRIAPQAIFALLPQGYFRDIGPDGAVHVKTWESANTIIPYFDVIFVSEQDGPDMHHTARHWSECMNGHVLVTQAAKGCTHYHKGQSTHIPAYPVLKEIHPTGAGDVFAAAYIHNFLAIRDPRKSIAYASVAAALHVAGNGIDTAQLHRITSINP